MTGEIRQQTDEVAGTRRRAKSWVAQSLAMLTLCATALACSSPPPAPPEATPIAKEYRVGPPDQLLITVLPDPIIERNVTVRPDGMISVDLIGDLPASGRTVEEIARDIEQRVARFKRDAVATVSVTLAQSATVTVFGEVRTQANFPLQRDTRVAEAIGLQGGMTIYASSGSIRVIRTDGQTTTVLPVDMNAIRNGDLSTNILLQEGDIIYVPPTIFAKVGYLMQQLLFPFQPALAIGTTAFTFMR